MYIKEIVFCAAVLIIQGISGQCGCNPNVVLTTPACGCPNTRYTASPCVASLTISPCPLASAPHIPAGMSILSDNLLIAGPVLAAGKLPFAGTVALEGALPAYGAGSVSYGCGDTVLMLAENPGYGRCGCGANYY